MGLGMRAVMLVSRYPPPYTAAGVRALYMAKALHERGIEVFVVPLNGTLRKEQKGDFGEYIVLTENLTYFKEGGFYRRPSLLRRSFDILLKHSKIFRKLYNVLKDINPDIIIAAVPPIEAPRIGYQLAKRFSARLIIDLQDIADDYRILERPYLAPLIKAYFRGVYRALQEATLVLVPTEFVARTISKRIGHNRILVVPNGVNNETYRACYEKRIAGKLAARAVFVGDLNFKYHKLDIFLKSFKIFKEKYNMDLYVRIIGDGIFLSKLKKLVKEININEYVEFMGYIDHDKIPNLIYDSLFGVAGRTYTQNPSIKDAMRLTTYEYLSCGIPILAYGPPNSYAEYFIKKYQVGVYIPSNDPLEIAEGIHTILKLLEKDNEIIHRCRKIALIYDWEKIMTRFVKELIHTI